MSKHWNPEIPAPARAKKRWPEGATVGLVIVAAACVGLAAMLYQVAGPRDVFEEPSD